MKKIVINACFGGFGLSHKAMTEYAKRKGINLYAYVTVRNPDGKLDFTKVRPYKDGDKPFCIHYSIMPLDEEGKIQKDSHISSYTIKRDDPILVSVVEDLKKEANGKYAELRIVEIPDDVEWGIDEYDGNETVSEAHRSWS